MIGKLLEGPSVWGGEDRGYLTHFKQLLWQRAAVVEKENEHLPKHCALY